MGRRKKVEVLESVLESEKTELTFLEGIKRVRVWRVPLGTARIICSLVNQEKDNLSKKVFSNIGQKVGLTGGGVRSFVAEVKRAYFDGYEGKKFKTLEEYYQAGRPCRTVNAGRKRGKQ